MLAWTVTCGTGSCDIERTWGPTCACMLIDTTDNRLPLLPCGIWKMKFPLDLIVIKLEQNGECFHGMMFSSTHRRTMQTISSMVVLSALDQHENQQTLGTHEPNDAAVTVILILKTYIRLKLVNVIFFGKK